MLTVLRRLVQLIQLFPDREASEHGDRVRVSPVGDRPGGAGAGGAGGHRPPLNGAGKENTMSILFLLGIAAAAVVLVLVVAAVTRR